MTGGEVLAQVECCCVSFGGCLVSLAMRIGFDHVDTCELRVLLAHL
jgi:hypothetical protein